MRGNNNINIAIMLTRIASVFFKTKPRIASIGWNTSAVGMRATTNHPVLGTVTMADSSSTPLALIVVPVPR